MVTLTVALKANTALTIPVFLAGAYAAHHGIQVDNVFENTSSVGSTKSAVELVTDSGDKLADAAIPHFFLDLLSSAGRVQGKQSEVCSWNHLTLNWGFR